jgi:hypothetical protein
VRRHFWAAPTLWAGALATVLALSLAGCAPAAQKAVVTVDVPGAVVTPTTKLHWELWAASSPTDVGTLVLQDDVAVTSLPASVTIAYQPTDDQRQFWLSARLDDWVLAPSPAVAAVAEVGRHPVWTKPPAPAAAAKP